MLCVVNSLQIQFKHNYDMMCPFFLKIQKKTGLGASAAFALDYCTYPSCDLILPYKQIDSIARKSEN